MHKTHKSIAKPAGADPRQAGRPAGAVPACEVDFAGKSADFAKLLRRRQGQPPLFLACCGFVLAILLMVAFGLCQGPRQLELPKSRPLVLGMSTDFNVEMTVEYLRSNFLVRDDDLAVEVIRREKGCLKKIPLRHVLVVKKFNAKEFGQREIRCFFLRNRLMSVLFVPKLSEDECKALLKGDFEETVSEGIRLGRERKSETYYQGECTGDDRLEIVDYVWGTEIRSVLLWKAYIKLVL